MVCLELSLCCQGKEGSCVNVRSIDSFFGNFKCKRLFVYLELFDLLEIVYFYIKIIFFLIDFVF